MGSWWILLVGLACASIAVLPGLVSAQAQDKELVAVLDLGILGGSPAEAAALTNSLRAELLKTGRVTLVDRSQMEAILQEQALQQSGCTSEECAVQVGQLLGVRKIVTGTLTKLKDDLWQVSVQLIDVESSETLRAEAFNHDGDFRSLLQLGMENAARLLVAAPAAETPIGAAGWTALGIGALLGLYAIQQYAVASDLDQEARDKASSDADKSTQLEEDRDAAAQNALIALAGAVISFALYAWVGGGDSDAAASRGAVPLVAVNWDPQQARSQLVLHWRW